MSIIDDLITDRKAADVAEVKSLLALANAGDAAAQYRLENENFKGSYNAADLNRVGTACAYLHGLITDMGYEVPNYTTPKTDWHGDIYDGDVPTAAQMQAYITNIAALKAVWSAAQAIPSTMDNLSYEGANNIERLLIEVEGQIERITAIYIYSGAWNAYSGAGFYIAK